MLIGKYIFVIPSAFLSWEVLETWASKRGPTPPRILILDIFSSYVCKKGCFLSFEWWKCNFSTFGPLQKYFWPTPGKSTTGPFLKKNPNPAPMFRGTCSCIEILKGYMARESLGTPVLDNSGRYCSVCKWQDKTEHELIKTTLISSFSYLNLGVEALFEELTQKCFPVARGLNFGPAVSLGGKLEDICLIQIIACTRWNTYKNIGNSVMRLTGFARTDARNHRKILREIFEKR